MPARPNSNHLPGSMPRLRILFLLLALALVLAGCGDTSSSKNNNGDTGDDTGNGDVTGDVDDDASTDTGDTDDDAGEDTGEDTAGDTNNDTGNDTGNDTSFPTVESIRIDPAMATINTDIGVQGTTQLNLVAIYTDGNEQPVTNGAVWSSDNDLVAGVDNTGLVTATGLFADTTTIEANYLGEIATADITVTLGQVTFAGGLMPGDEVPIDGGVINTSSNVPAWQYPEAETVFPSGMIPPLIQWDTGGNSYFKLTLTRGNAVSINVYTDLNEYQPTEEQWRALAGSGFGDPIQLDLYGKTTLDAGAERNEAPQRIVFSADADLSGAVYYWAPTNSGLYRIDEGATSPTALTFPDTYNGDSCEGCHALSRDGSKLAFMYNGGGDPRAGLALTANLNPPIIADGSPFQWDFMTFDPTGNRLAAVYYGDMSLWDVTLGTPNGAAKITELPQASVNGAPSTNPTWSPDGSTLAYVSRGGTVDWSYTSGNLYTLGWDTVNEVFAGAPTQLLAAPGGAEDTISYPTWSPDSKWLGVGVGPSNRAATGMYIHLVDPLTGNHTRMARGGTADGRDVFPSFSPFIEGGYYWLLFYSSRPYGHVTTNKQLWVMAIDADHTDGTDSSHPAFWLPGQGITDSNITGYWAPSPCVGDGGGCTDSGDCCMGLTCHPDDDGNPVCGADSCSPPGGPCESNADCCESSPTYICLPNLNGDNVCQLQPN